MGINSGRYEREVWWYLGWIWLKVFGCATSREPWRMANDDAAGEETV